MADTVTFTVSTDDASIIRKALEYHAATCGDFAMQAGSDRHAWQRWDDKRADAIRMAEFVERETFNAIAAPTPESSDV